MTNLADHVDAALLLAIVPAVRGRKGMAQAKIISQLAAQLPTLMAIGGITTPLRLAHFLAQIAHESDSFCTLEEYASGAAYEGRQDLGNTRVGDGRRYKGRDLIQLTGRANYRAFTAWADKQDGPQFADIPDFEALPFAVSRSEWMGLPTVWFWSTKGLNALADRDDLIAVTRRINGGTNGLAHRRALLAKAKAAVDALAASLLQGGGALPILARGSEGSSVELLQRALSLDQIPLAIDGDFGPATAQAVRMFQRERAMQATGIVDGATWRRLEPFLNKLKADA